LSFSVLSIWQVREKGKIFHGYLSKMQLWIISGAFFRGKIKKQKKSIDFSAFFV